MGRILEAFRIFKQDLQELENAEELKKILPTKIKNDMRHEFVYGRKLCSQQAADAFDTTLEKQPHVFHTALNYTAYIESNAQNQLIMHGILFNALLNMYLRHFKKGFDNILLSCLPEKHDENSVYFLSKIKKNNVRTIIDFYEYEKLPKRYRCLFVRYDEDNYVLNAPESNLVISYNKHNKSKIEKLFLRAKMLIPVIYKEKTLTSYGTSDLSRPVSIATYKEPHFVADSNSSKRISNEQLKTVHELHDIFVEIAKITFPIKTNFNAKSRDVYNEYIQEQVQKGIVLNTYNAANTVKDTRDQGVANEEKHFKQKTKSINENYQNNRQCLLTSLSEHISVRIK